MMVPVFVTMLLGLGLGWFVRRWLGLAFVALSFVLALGQFLFEVYSPEHGFSMPWIQTQVESATAPMGG
jgi:hypothetical protein